jgi:hypothetical protein
MFGMRCSGEEKNRRNQINVPKIDILIDPQIPVQRNVESVANVTLATIPSYFASCFFQIFFGTSKFGEKFGNSVKLSSLKRGYKIYSRPVSR